MAKRIGNLILFVRGCDLKFFIAGTIGAKAGVIVDTNILFAANYSLDSYHEEAVEIFKILDSECIPRFANTNVRSEFIHLTRKIVIIQALLDLFHEIGTDLPQAVYNKLKSLKTRSGQKEKAEALFRIQDDEIKEIRQLLMAYRPSEKQDLWDWFCEDYFQGKIAAEWAWVVEDFGINFLTFRHNEMSQHLMGELKWEDVVGIIERTGIGSADAMILNLFIQSRYVGIISGDSDISFAMERLKPKNKYVVKP